MCHLVAAPTNSSTASSFALSIRERKPLSSQMKDVCISPSTVNSNNALRQHLYQHLSAGYQLPTVWYNTVMKKSIIDPLSNVEEYDLPTVHGERKELPEVSTGVTPIEDPKTENEVADKLVLPLLVTIRHKKMKKHKRKKFRKRMRFVMRKRRQLKEKRKERAIQKYEREQAELGQLYNAEHVIDEQLVLARKSGWHVDIIAEFNREREKERAATAVSASAAASSSDSSSKQ